MPLFVLLLLLTSIAGNIIIRCIFKKSSRDLCSVPGVAPVAEPEPALPAGKAKED